MDLGKPDEDFTNSKGNFEFVYNTKKYGIPCERRFEVNTKSIVIGFVSNGCFWLPAENLSPQARYTYLIKWVFFFYAQEQFFHKILLKDHLLTQHHSLLHHQL